MIDIQLDADGPQSNYQVIDTKDKFLEFERQLSNAALCAIDTETNGKDPRCASLLGVSISFEVGAAFYIPMVQQSLKGVSRDEMIKCLASVLAKEIRVVGHNLKFDSLVLRKHGVEIKVPYFDTMLAAYECYGDSEYFNLSFLAKKLLGKKIKRYRDIVGSGETFLDVPFSELVEHACCDADTALQLYEKLSGELAKRKLTNTFLSERMPLMTKLEMVENYGLRVNSKALGRHADNVSELAAELKKKIYSEVGSQFDLESFKAIGEMLRAQEWFRENFGIRHISSSSIEQLASRHPLIGLIADYRRLSRRKKEIDGIILGITDGKVFPLFNQIKLPCGKISSTDPNLDEVFAAGAANHNDLQDFCHGPDRAVQELSRVANDPALYDDLRRKEPQKVFRAVPFIGKSNFSDVLLSVVVNLSDEALSRHFSISRQTAMTVRREISARYTVTCQWLDEFKRSALANGFAEHEGRRKYLDGLRSSDIEKKNKAVMSTIRWLLRY